MGAEPDRDGIVRAFEEEQAIGLDGADDAFEFCPLAVAVAGGAGLGGRQSGRWERMLTDEVYDARSQSCGVARGQQIATNLDGITDEQLRGGWPGVFGRNDEDPGVVILNDEVRFTENNAVEGDNPPRGEITA